MSSAFTIFTGIWPLKTWITRWRKPAEEEATGSCPAPSVRSKVYEKTHEAIAPGDAESDSASLTYQSIREPWVEISTPTGSQHDGRSLALKSKSGSDGAPARENGQVETCQCGAEDGRASTPNHDIPSHRGEPLLRRGEHDPYLSDMIPALERVRHTNHEATQLIFEWNSISAPLFKQMETVIQSLTGFMHGMAVMANTSGVPKDFAPRFAELRKDFEMMYREHFAAFETDRSRYTKTENDIIQTLYRSSRLLDGILSGDPGVSSFGQDSDISVKSSRVELEGELIEPSPGVERYSSQLGEVDTIRERLAELQAEIAQLSQEQISRAQFGLSLDDESLQFLEEGRMQEQVIFEELEYAVLVLDALERLLHEPEALQIPIDHPFDGEMEEAGLIDEIGGPAIPETVVAPWTTEQSWPFQLGLQTRTMKFSEHLSGPSSAPIHPANFINRWLLQRSCSMPRLLRLLVALIQKHRGVVDLQSAESVFIDIWFNDGSAADFARYRTFADQQSKLVSVGDSRLLQARTDAAGTAHVGSAPLLKMGPSVTAQDIIAQAIRTRDLSTS
ncbi:hypothetical protein A1O1_06637 [Capronia coronata CBS 617.96]|uniref:Uncharacterized protein n=1 Tax=Capronia coronata CBS 617.96 TaxID=1182541 RepID=W9Y0C8_9EURO|nr:uncharacterized protein A1O1_06637 [Capronia coronata CBS 617.96]EXJ86267.1 hypothetical protein A1O1_06637 [Capronia coronata CBS 617.96]